MLLSTSFFNILLTVLSAILVCSIISFAPIITFFLIHSNTLASLFHYLNIYDHLDSNSKRLSAQIITSAFETKKEIEECDSSTSSNKLVACAK